MFEILLMGLLVVAVFVISHHAVGLIELHHGRPLGHWRSAWFFVIFLVLMLASTSAIRPWMG